ncbi:MAG: hypothetical protein CMJ64_15150 [Planctomycetaceae bacterium]|nr:hypothetical protein [Planctomycetaceae bacterium]
MLLTLESYAKQQDFNGEPGASVPKGQGAVFFKHWGGVCTSVNGHELDRRTYDEFPLLHRNGVSDATTRKKLAADSTNVWPGRTS